jgi:hypothetical protein
MSRYTRQLGADANKMKEAIKSLIQTSALTLAMLEAIEWCENTTSGFRYSCPFCKHSRNTGHAEDCQLAQTLKMHRGILQWAGVKFEQIQERDER